MLGFMKGKDARSFSSDAHEQLRMRAIGAIRQGMGPTEVGRLFGVSRAAVHNWINLQRLGGKRALKAHRRGRPRSENRSLEMAADFGDDGGGRGNSVAERTESMSRSIG